jgi:hypothetical protein
MDGDVKLLSQSKELPMTTLPNQLTERLEAMSLGDGLRAGEFALWREAMAHLRHLSDDLWKGMRLFLPLNGLLLAMIVALLAFQAPSRRRMILVILISIIGILLTLAARYLLKRHRIYYLQMLAKKSLLDEGLGLYQAKFAGSETDLVLPWRLSPEVVAEIKSDLEAWVRKSVRGPATMARVQFLIYEGLLACYGFSLAAACFISVGHSG